MDEADDIRECTNIAQTYCGCWRDVCIGIALFS